MASKLFGVAIATLRNRGHSDIMGGTTFGVADGEKNAQEYHRLERAGHIREATADEVTLYEHKVKNGEVSEQLLGATAEEAEAAGIAVTGAVNTGADSAPVTEPVKADGGAKKDPAGAGSTKKTASADDL